MNRFPARLHLKGSDFLKRVDGGLQRIAFPALPSGLPNIGECIATFSGLPALRLDSRGCGIAVGSLDLPEKLLEVPGAFLDSLERAPGGLPLSSFRASVHLPVGSVSCPCVSLCVSFASSQSLLSIPHLT